MTPKRINQVIDHWQETADRADTLHHTARQIYLTAYLDCPADPSGKAPAEHLRSAYAERTALDARLDAEIARNQAQADRLLIDYMIQHDDTPAPTPDFFDGCPDPM